jgi:hypothetical protein
MSKTKTSQVLVLAALAGAIGLAACSTTPVHLIVDPSLATAEVYEVDGLTNRYWGKPLKFGPFRTEKTRVGETWRWTGGVFGLEAGTEGKPFRFRFVGDKGEVWQVECRSKTPILGWRTRHSETRIDIGETRLGCAMRDPEGTVHSLALHGTGAGFLGETTFGPDSFEIRTLNRLPGRDGRTFSVPGALGYEIRHGEQVIASVDLIGHGRVYLAKQLPAGLRTPVAMTATVLMFFNET